LLGAFGISVDGLPVADAQWQRRKAKTLVKLLALQPQHQIHREQLMEMLLPELEPEAAGKNLNKLIYMARRALEPELKAGGLSRFILTREQNVILSAPGGLWIDADAFEQQAKTALTQQEVRCDEEALALYAGELLGDDPYEEWAQTRREQLRLLQHRLLKRLAQLYEERGEPALGAARLETLLALDPVDENAHRQWMRLYAAQGDRHQALQQYKQCCDVLRRELGVAPVAETQELYRQLTAANAPTPPAPAPSALPARLSEETAPRVVTPLPPLAPRLRNTWLWTVLVLASAVTLAVAGWFFTRAPQTLTGRETNDPAAHDAYFKGRYYLNKRNTEDYKRAIALFEQATDRNPTYAGLADAYVLLARSDVLPPREAFPKAQAAVQRALALDPNLAEAATALAQVKLHYAWDLAEAEREFARALSLNPNDANTHHWQARLLFLRGHVEDSLKASQRASQLAPLELGHAPNWALYYQRRFDEVIAENRKLLALHPNYPNGHSRLGKAYLHKRQFAEARAEFEQTLKLDDRTSAWAWLAHTLALAGQEKEAREILQKLTGAARQRYVSAYSLALIHTGLGDREQAFAWLDKAYEDRDGELLFLHLEPALDSLRTDARFTTLIRRVGVAQ
jgi:DNA-binding SARP family transcriptional activator